MDEKDVKIVQGNYVEIVRILEARNVVGFLYQEGVLNDHDKEKVEKIGNLSTSKEQNENLLDTLLKRKDGLKVFIKALLVSEVQAFLGHQLLEVVEWSKEDMEKFKLELEGKIDQQQMLEATIAALNQEINQLKGKEAEQEKTIKEITDQNHVLVQENNQPKEKEAKYEKTIKDITDQIQVLVAEMKQEIDQLKAKKAEQEKMIKDITDQNQVLVAELKQENDQLKAKKAEQEKTIKDITDQNQVLVAELKQENYQLKAKKAEYEKTIKDITDQNQILVDWVEALKLKDTFREETLETIESSEQEYPQRRARRNAISRKGSCATYQILLKSEKIKMLHKEINQLKAKNNGISETNLLREEQASTWNQVFQQRNITRNSRHVRHF